MLLNLLSVTTVIKDTVACLKKKNWSDNGIRVIYDKTADDGEFYTFEELKAMFNIRGTFLDYQRIINSIPQTWKTLINNNRVFLIENRYNTI